MSKEKRCGDPIKKEQLQVIKSAYADFFILWNKVSITQNLSGKFNNFVGDKLYMDCLIVQLNFREVNGILFSTNGGIFYG